MPICEADPWRLQYFAHVNTAANIPTEDSDAWQWYPAHRWVYDKLAVALEPKSRCRAARRAAAAFSGFLQADHQSQRHGRRQPRAQIASRLRRALRARPFLDDAARRPPCLLRRRGGRRRAALVAARHRQARGRGHLRLLDRACRAAMPASRRIAATWVRKILPAIPACSISKPSARTSSRRICALPTNGPISTARAGSMRWSASTSGTHGISTTTTAAKAIASCCSGRTAAATAIRRRLWSTR